MSSLWHLIAAALVLGAQHSFGPDHLAAVSAFVSRKPSPRHAAGLGARWALGHSATILLVGGAIILSGLRLPVRFAPLAERLVGVVLIMVGLSAIWRAWRLHAHLHTHEGTTHFHVHSHAASPAHDHSHGALFGIGMLHGLAGTGALVALIPAFTDSRLDGLIFLVVFGLGTVISMSLFGASAGQLLQMAVARRAPLQRAALATAGLASVIVGAWWLGTGGI